MSAGLLNLQSLEFSMGYPTYGDSHLSRQAASPDAHPTSFSDKASRPVRSRYELSQNWS